jgi:branched-chain amino acid transport system substrate-binding protein
MTVLYTYAHNAHPELKTVAMIVTDDAVSIQEAKDLGTYITPIGFEVLPPVKVSGDETDFYPVLTPLIKRGVDIIDLASPAPEDASLIIKQARELGYKGIFVHADAPNIDDYAAVAGWPALEGFIGAPVYTELTAVGTSTGPTADYDSILLLAAAIEKVGTVDPQAVNAALPTVSVQGTTGETHFGGADVLGIPHLLERPINVVEVKNGKIVSVFNGWPPRITATMSPSPSP